MKLLLMFISFRTFHKAILQSAENVNVVTFIEFTFLIGNNNLKNLSQNSMISFIFHDIEFLKLHPKVLILFLIVWLVMILNEILLYLNLVATMSWMEHRVYLVEM